LDYRGLVFSLLALLLSSTDPHTTQTYTLALHDALPICRCSRGGGSDAPGSISRCRRTLRTPATSSCTALSSSRPRPPASAITPRSEEHTSELQSHLNLVCRLLLEKKNKTYQTKTSQSNL